MRTKAEMAFARKNLEKAEREVVRLALLRLKVWKKDNPEGLFPKGHPQAAKPEVGRRLIEACLALEKLRDAP